MNGLLQENLQSGFVWDRMDCNTETGNLTLWLLNLTCKSFQVPAAIAFILFPGICLHQQRWKNNFWDGKQPWEKLHTPINQMTEWWLADSTHRLMWDLNHDVGLVHRTLKCWRRRSKCSHGFCTGLHLAD